MLGVGFKPLVELFFESVLRVRKSRPRSNKFGRQFLVAGLTPKWSGFGIVPLTWTVPLSAAIFSASRSTSVGSCAAFSSGTRTPAFWSRSRLADRQIASVRPANVLKMTFPCRPSTNSVASSKMPTEKVAALVDERRKAIEAAERETQALLLRKPSSAPSTRPCAPWPVAPLVRRPRVEIDLDAAYPELGVRSFGRGTTNELPGVEVGDKQLFRICAGDLVFNIVFAWEGAVAVASQRTMAASVHIVS